MNAKALSTRERYAAQLVANFDSKFFKVLSEPVRVEILRFLILHGSSDIGSIAQALPQDRSVISRHLKFMHEAEILHCEKISRNVFYEVNAGAIRDKLEGIAGAITQCLAACCPDRK